MKKKRKENLNLNHCYICLFSDYANCTYAKGQNLQQNTFISLSQIRDSQPAGFLLQLQLFIRGDRDCHIILSPNDTNVMPRDNYDIGK